MGRKAVVWALVVGVASACARVPSQSVELSATVGRDMAVVHVSHRELVKVLFGRLRKDVHRFVDEVYAPWQIRMVMERQRDLAASANPDDRKKALLLAIDAAFKQGAPADLQAKALSGMGLLVQAIHEDVERMRQELLRPLEAQEKEVLDAIDSAYTQIHYANSIVTGHLASVVEVHDTQDELLAKAGAPSLRREISDTLAEASAQIGDLVDQVSSTGAPVAEADKTAQELKTAIGTLGAHLSPGTPQPPSTENPNAQR